MVAIKWPKWLLWGFLGLVALGLFGCSTYSNVRITNVSVSPDPIVGQIVTLSVEAVSEVDSPDASIGVLLPDSVGLISGNLTWHGSLISGQPQSHELTICVLEPGVWEIITGAGITLTTHVTDGDGEFVYLESGVESAQLLSMEQAMTEHTYHGIPTPVSPPIEISEACAGNAGE